MLVISWCWLIALCGGEQKCRTGHVIAACHFQLSKLNILWTQEELMLSINLMRFDVMVYMFPSSTAQVFVIHVVAAMLYIIGMPMRLISMFWLPIFKSLS